MPSRGLAVPVLSKQSVTKRIRALTKKNLANLRFAARDSPVLPFCIFFLLFIPSLLTLYICWRTIQNVSDAYSPNFILRTNTSDPCSRAQPIPLVHFDPSNRSSAEFNNPVATDVDPPGLNRVFTTFFKIYLFQPNSDIVVNLSANGRGLPTDIRNALFHSQRVLRSFFADESIVVHNYSLGYSHLDRVRGSRYIFHLDSSSSSSRRRRDVVALQRTFDGRCYVSVKEFGARIFSKPVHMIVPYSKRPTRLKWFLGQFDRLRRRKVNVRLILAVYKNLVDDVATAHNMVAAMSYSKYAKVISVAGDRTGFFSRAVAIREGAAHVPTDSIMFISDIDMYVFPTMFDSCRYNSIQGSQVYFPVFYSLYARSSRIDKNAGYWRDSSLGMSCMYKSDFDAIRAYEHAESRFVGWGGEDLSLSQSFLNHSKYEVFRAVEPALRHKWHVKHCEPLTLAYKDCLEVAFQQLGSAVSLGRYFLDNKIDIQSIFSKYDEEAGSENVHLVSDGVVGLGHKSEDDKMIRRKAVLRKNLEALKKRRTSKA